MNIKNFEGNSLIYVTPWNNHGYDIAKTFASKFTYISPVWFQLQQSLEWATRIDIAGEHNVDQGWLNEVWYGESDPDEESVGERRKRTKIVPRIRFEQFNLQTYSNFIRNVQFQYTVLDNLLKLYKYVTNLL